MEKFLAFKKSLKVLWESKYESGEKTHEVIWIQYMKIGAVEGHPTPVVSTYNGDVEDFVQLNEMSNLMSL